MAFFSKGGLLGTLFYQKGVFSHFKNVTTNPFKTFKDPNFRATCAILGSKQGKNCLLGNPIGQGVIFFQEEFMGGTFFQRADFVL